jgi:hypothetical protein
MVHFDPTWGLTPLAITHKYEFLIESILNQQLFKYNLRAKRIEENPFSDYDLGIYLFDFEKLQYGNEICKLDLERKPNDVFPREGIPLRWSRGYSFLQRKTRKEINYDRDAYMLFDNNPTYPRCRWINYFNLREFGIPKSFNHWGAKNEFIEIKEGNFPKVFQGYRSFIQWCNCLQNKEILK